jgi:hypothetical protein
MYLLFMIRKQNRSDAHTLQSITLCLDFKTVTVSSWNWLGVFGSEIDTHRVGDTGLEPVTPSLSNAEIDNVSATIKGLTLLHDPNSLSVSPSEQDWLHNDPTGVSPLETIRITFEEFLQSADITHRFSLSAVLASGNRTIRLNSIAQIFCDKKLATQLSSTYIALGCGQGFPRIRAGPNGG